MIRSHIIPKFYLKQLAFEKPNGKHYVYLYEKGKKPADRWIKSVGRELGYFGYLLPDGTIEESKDWLEIYRQLDEAITEDDYADELAQRLHSPLF
jgi:hypothetical protein